MEKYIFTAMATLSLYACADHDLPYYQSNLLEAKNKTEQCEADLQKAFDSGNENKVTAIMEDAECEAASKAHAEHKRKLANLERKKREEEKAKQREIKEAQFTKDVEQYTNDLTDMPIADFYAVRKECRPVFGKNPGTAKCVALDKVQEAKIADEVHKLIKQHEKELLSQRDKECSWDKTDDYPCAALDAAVENQRMYYTDYYLDDRELLKSTFNACQARYSQLREMGKYAEAKEHVGTFDCKMVEYAANEIKVFGFYKPID